MSEAPAPGPSAPPFSESVLERLSAWAVTAGWWLLLCVWLAGDAMALPPAERPEGLPGFFARHFLLLLGLSWVLDQITRRWRSKFRRGVFVLIACGLCLLAAALVVVLQIESAARLSPEILEGIFAEPVGWATAADIWLFHAVAFGAWFAGWLGHEARVLRRRESERSLRLQAALHASQLHALGAQINPHFLFNALNSVRALLPAEAAPARDAVTRLAVLLRASLEAHQVRHVTLAEELSVVDSYLGLEQIRLDERLRVWRGVSPEAVACRLPPLVVLTLVENAVKHGIACRREGGLLRILGRVEAGVLHVEVTNPGDLSRPAAGASTVVSTRVGLSVTRERLRLLHGDAAGLELRQADERTVAARLWLPVTAAESSSPGVAATSAASDKNISHASPAG